MVVAFVRFLYEMLTNPEFAHVFQWDESGTAFKIIDQEALQVEIFPRFFKCKWVSFLTYFSKAGFVKRMGYWAHPCFTRENPQLDQIKMPQGSKKNWPRYTSESSSSDSESSSSSPSSSSHSLCRSDHEKETSIHAVVGYTCNFQYCRMQPGETAYFFVQGKYVQADSSTLPRYSYNPIAIPCVIAGKQNYLLHGALFHTSMPLVPIDTLTVFAYQQGSTRMHLLPEDAVACYYRGQWRSVITKEDVEIAERPDSSTYIVRPGDCFVLQPGTHLYYSEDNRTALVYRPWEQGGRDNGQGLPSDSAY